MRMKGEKKICADVRWLKPRLAIERMLQKWYLSSEIAGIGQLWLNRECRANEFIFFCLYSFY